VCPGPRLLDDVGSVYAVQSAWVAERLDAGAVVTDWKIGLTSPVVQAQLGDDSPDFGVLLDEMAVAAGGAANMTLLLQTRIEAEVTFVLGADLKLARPTDADMVAATCALGAPVRAGDVVLSGAPGPMVDVHAGDQFEAEVDELGAVSVTFGSTT
jgi:2-keto-4-pentenoate hydratase